MYLGQTKQNSICTSECGCRCVGPIRESYFTASEYDNNYISEVYRELLFGSSCELFIPRLHYVVHDVIYSEWETL